MKSVSVPIELLERITRPQLKPRDETVRRRAITELRAILDKQAECRCKRYGKDNPHWPCPVHAEPSAQHQGEPVAIVTGSTVQWLPGAGKLKDRTPLYAEQTAPVADQPQCEECKGWGYHENHHEGGGTECGECGGSGNATVEVMPDVDELAQIIRKVDGSHALGAGSLAEAILEEVARLNGVKP